MPPKTTNQEKLKHTNNPNRNSPYTKILLFSGIILSILAYYALTWITTPPPLPPLDMNQYWGTYPMDQKQDTSIRPFHIEFPEMMIQDLKERLLHYRKPPLPIENSGFTYGFNSNFLTQVVDYWRNRYNFKERENFLNKYEHYVTNIQGLDIHFMHVKSREENVTVIPLLLLHGWPGSIRQFYEMIPELIKPREKQTYVFEIIAPSLPGFGFSQGSTRPGLGMLETSVIIHNLMKRIGHEYYYIHGCSAVAVTMATVFPRNVKGFHVVEPYVNRPLAHFYIWLGSFWPSLIETPELKSRLYPIGERLNTMLDESAQFHLEATKPDTIGAALSDSPTGLAVYILDRFASSKEAYDGRIPELYSLTNLLDNIMIYWMTNSVTTSMRLYMETLKSRLDFFMYIDSIPTHVPTCGIKFKHSKFYQPDSIIRMKYIKYLRTTVVNDGGNNMAFGNPDILANDVVEAVEVFLKFHGQKGDPQPTPNLSTPKPAATPQTVYDFTVNDIHGTPVNLNKYKGKVLIIVNVASQCGLTDTNYKELNLLNEKYYDRGLRILAFPCNQFNGQEPGSARDILNFVKEKNVSFDLFEKIEVNGENTNPLWKFLKNKLSGTLGDFIKWNFSKFIVDRNGVPVERFSPTVNPLDLEPYLEKYLGL